MKFIDYNNMADYYTVADVCRLFEMEKSELRRYCEKFHINPRDDLYDDYDCTKTDVRKLHNLIYRELKNKGGMTQTHRKKADPWA